MTAAITRNFDAQATAELLNYSSLVRVLQQVILEYGAGKIVSPEHMVVPMQEGGLMLSMPASVRPVTWLRAASPVRR
ncbi:hypothetical protein [Paraburkholderia sp. BL10I2N1]|uniref:hypothetical protein n=1 Tax=Paraburkholderia sp. BL10I2N1 TaxID=1938796 RepID=UPI00105B2BB8|nr:hypothetical protein [Paraburkholderia sp. BL10I2N1]